MRGIVAPCKGTVFRQFVLYLVELGLRDDCRNCRYWNPLLWGEQCSTGMGATHRKHRRPPDARYTIPHSSSKELTSIDRVTENSPDGSQAPDRIASWRAHLERA